jgi:hypothetical protein
MIEKKECWSVDEECFDAAGLGDLIGSHHDELEVGTTVYVADAVTPDPADYIDVDGILEKMGERAGDDCGEYADDYPDVSKDARQELEDVLKTWARKHCTPRFWKVKNVREYILTADDLTD